MERHHINSVEFELWLNEFSPEFLKDNDENRLYDMWAEGYSAWEVESILS